MSSATRILQQIEQGDLSAAEQLLPLVYGELRRLATAKLANEKPGQTLQATALVHEAYIRLVDAEKAQAISRIMTTSGQPCFRFPPIEIFMQHGYDPYEPRFSRMSEPSPRNSWTWPILILVIGGPLFVFVLCCGGGAGLMMFGLNVLSAEIEMELRDHPQFKEHVGEVQSFEMDWAKSFAEEGDDVFVYNVEGSEGSGEITVESITNEAGQEEVASAQLRLSTGEVIDLEF